MKLIWQSTPQTQHDQAETVQRNFSVRRMLMTSFPYLFLPCCKDLWEGLLLMREGVVLLLLLVFMMDKLMYVVNHQFCVLLH